MPRFSHTHFVDVIKRLDSEVFKGFVPSKTLLYLVIQIKGSDVHPHQRHPDFLGVNKKTQLDITAPMHLDSGLSPVSALFTRRESGTRQPVRILHPKRKKWIETHIKITPKVKRAKGPAPDQTRILLGGTDRNSWSSELWANIGHHKDDRNAFIIFVRMPNELPVCFALPRDEALEEFLMYHGSSNSRWNWPLGRFSHMDNTPRTKAVVIDGPNTENDKDFALEFIYIVTNPKEKGWVKIGKTKQDPKSRLRQFNHGPTVHDMNYILPTSNCDEAEREIIKRLDQLGVPKEGNEWYKLGHISPAMNVLDEVQTAFPCRIPVISISPILSGKDSWVENE